MTEIKKYHRRITHNFGDRHRFGITFEMPESREEYFGRYLRGSICYWFFANQIGDMAYGVPLACEGLGMIKYTLKKYSFRGKPCPHIFNADGRLIVDVMNNDLENEEENISESPFGFVRDWEFWSTHHNIQLELDVMDDNRLLYFENETQARIIWAP